MQTAPLKPARAAPLKTHGLAPPDRAGDPQDQAREIDLVAMMQVLWRGKWFIALVMAVTVGLGALYAFVVADPLYTSTAVVALQNRDEQVISLEAVVSGIGSDQASINTEIEVLRSRELMGKLVDRLDLMADPEFNPALRPSTPWSVGSLIGAAKALLGAAPPEPLTQARIRQKTIDNVLGAISVSNVRQSYVFEISPTTLDPAKSALVADTLADAYILNQRDLKAEATAQATEWLRGQVADLKDELAHAATAVKTFNTGATLISPERLEATNRQLKEFRAKRADLALRQEQLDVRVAELEAARRTGDAARMAEVAGIAAPDRATSGDAGEEIDTAERQRLTTGFQRVLDRAHYEQDQVGAQIDVLSSSIAEIEAQIAAQSDDLLELEQLEREAGATQALYEYFLGRLKETSVQQGIQQPDSRLLSSAVVKPDPSSPRRALVLAVSGLLGLFIGSTIVLIREARNATYRTAEELEQESGVTVIGQVPRAPHGRRRRIVDYVATKPTSALVEAIRNLRTSILLANIDRPTKVIMLTSSVPGEGKSVLSLSLAQNLAAMGRRVLIIEGDLRRQIFREVFDVGDAQGIAAAALEEAPLDQVVHRDPALGFDVLLGERVRINAADFFSSDRFRSLLDRARREYDYVVIDTPPVLLVPDARIIGQTVDVVIYAVHWDKTSRAQVREGLHSFAMVNVPVTGTVLTQVDPSGMRRYGHGSYEYGKSYYEN